MANLPLSKDQLAALCHEIDQEVEYLVAAQAAGTISESRFAEGLLQFLTKSAGGGGLIFHFQTTRNGWTHLSLKVRESSDPCAEYEYHAGTGAFRTVGSASAES